MKTEFTYVSKRKIYWALYLFIFLNIIVIEMPYVFFASPIGIFHGDNIDNGVSIINTFGSILSMNHLDASTIVSEFNRDYRNAADGIGLLSAHTIDRLGCIFYMLSIVIGANIVRRSDFMKRNRQGNLECSECFGLLIKRYVLNVIYSAVVLAMILILPYTCLSRMKAMGYTGNPMQLYVLFFKWVVPTICIAYAFQLFITAISKEPVMTYLLHAISFPIMLSLKENKYPFYQFVIRAGEKNHEYFKGYGSNIAINRICMIVFSVALLIGACKHLCKHTDKNSAGK